MRRQCHVRTRGHYMEPQRELGAIQGDTVKNVPGSTRSHIIYDGIYVSFSWVESSIVPPSEMCKYVYARKQKWH